MARKHPPLPPSGVTILVVDDQPEVLTSTRAVLERDGHHVLTAASGAEALAQFVPGQVQLVLVDFAMPGMSGEDVIHALRATDPAVPIVLQSGGLGARSPLELVRALNLQGYHGKTAGPDALRLWVECALRAGAKRGAGAE